MTTMNGAKHDVEDILASIRTSIADRAPMFESERREARVATLRGRSAIADEAAEFELPAIFKAPAQSNAARPNLLGRLSEALASGGPQERERSRTVIPFEPAHGRMLEPPPVEREAERDNSFAAAEKLAAENDSLKRNMPTFFDTRMTRMSGMSQPEPQAEPEPVFKKPAAVELPHPPRLPDLPMAAEDGGNVEDAAAQLLRPILRQWLSENMPKIVEKALMTETGFNGHGGPSRR
jgi:cell pole-organizing protein PopZ